MCWGPKEADVIGKIERTIKWREEVCKLQIVTVRSYIIKF